MNKNIGFIGCGKMAGAIIAGILNAKLVLPEKIMASAQSEETIDKASNLFGIHMTSSNQKVAEFSDYLFIAVKPDVHSKVLKEIKSSIQQNALIITIAAGIDLAIMEEMVGSGAKVVRSMPNTPSLIGEGMTAICPNPNVTNEELKDVLPLFKSFGQVEIVEEKLMDSIPAISGSSPAYVYMFIEALADGGVLQGIPREKAYRLAAQAVVGAAKMVLETGKHPGELKDQVCTPGGATIEAVSALEKNNFRGSILTAMEKCTEKSKLLKN